MIRRVVVDPGIPLEGLADGVEVVVGGPVSSAPHQPGEVVVASAEPERLAEAGRLGAHRLVVDDPATAGPALVELCADLARASPR